MSDKKFKIANRCSFILFMCYILTYIILPIYAKDIKYLMFLIFPLIFLIALVVNLALKYDKLKTNDISGFSKIIAIASVLFNGLGSIASAAFVGGIDWKEKKEQAKKYPSIEPAWVFVIMFTTIVFNLIFGMVLSLEGLNLNLILIFSGISLIFLVLCQISSSFSLYYNNGKNEIWKFWRNIIIVFLGLILIFCLSGGFEFIIDEYNKEKEKAELQEHIDNINNVINNNKNK